MSFETEQRLREMLRWLSYDEAAFEHMDAFRRDEYLRDGLNMAINVVKSLHADSLNLSNGRGQSPLVLMA